MGLALYIHPPNKCSVELLEVHATHLGCYDNMTIASTTWQLKAYIPVDAMCTSYMRWIIPCFIHNINMIKRSTVNYMGSDGHNIVRNECTEDDKNSFAARIRENKLLFLKHQHRDDIKNYTDIRREPKLYMDAGTESKQPIA
jgi:uncharacterized protein (UPF0305 family)